jgi:uncharacterized protein (DUF1778 family)
VTATKRDRAPRRQAKARVPQELTFQFRVSARTREKIDAAAEILGMTRTQFVMATAEKAATDVLLDRRLFELDEEAFKAFVDILDKPPAPSAQLIRLFKEKAPWDT